MEMHLVLLEIARKDLEAASYLLERKLFSHSVFLLQQSVEKTVKSLGIWTKLICIADAKSEIGHLAYKIHMKFLENFSKRRITNSSLSTLESFGIERESIDRQKLEADSVLTLFSKFPPRGPLALSFLSSSNLLQNTLTSIQTYMQEMKKNRIEFRHQLEKVGDQEVQDLKRELSRFLNTLLTPEDAKGYEKTLDEIAPEELIDLLKRHLRDFVIPDCELYFCWASLFALSIVFSAHETTTRYPEGNFNPLEFYIEDTPLVHMLHPFIEVMEEIHTSLSDVYAKMQPPDFT